jgi:Cupin-like domain
MNAVFDSTNRMLFGENYPETPHKLRHSLGDHPLMSLEALAKLGEALPVKSVEYNKGDLPVGIDPELVPANGLSIGETIRRVEECRSWAVLKNIEQMPEYQALLIGLLAELKPQIEEKTGRMMRPQGFVFVSSPDAVTPYHFDPEHNILLQLRGKKVMTQFPAGDPRFAPDETHEGYHTGGHRNLVWRDELAAGGTPWSLSPGEALFVPVMAPHHVKNGPEPSISLSITWRSDWSFAEADARAFNGLLRKVGIRPRAPGRFPAQNKAKSYAWRLVSRVKKQVNSGST